jgi:hypothetical protein
LETKNRSLIVVGCIIVADELGFNYLAMLSLVDKLDTDDDVVVVVQLTEAED